MSTFFETQPEMTTNTASPHSRTAHHAGHSNNPPAIRRGFKNYGWLIWAGLVVAFLSPTQLCAGNIGWITSYLYTRYPFRPGDTYDYYYRPNITTMYVGQTIDVLMTVYDA